MDRKQIFLRVFDLADKILGIIFSYFVESRRWKVEGGRCTLIKSEILFVIGMIEKDIIIINIY